MEKQTKTFWIGWLSGIIDGEGSVYCTNRYRKVTIPSTDMEIVEGVETALKLLGVVYSVRTERRNHKNPLWKDIHIVVVQSKENLQILSNELKLIHKVKKERLSSIAGTYTNNDYNVTLMRKMYIDQGMTQKSIAEELGFKSWHVRHVFSHNKIYKRKVSQK